MERRGKERAVEEEEGEVGLEYRMSVYDVSSIPQANDLQSVKPSDEKDKEDIERDIVGV